MATELPRVKEAIEVLKKFNIKANIYVDLGCNDGSIAVEIAKTVNARMTYCIDIDDEALGKAKERGLITHKADLSIDKIPLNNKSADLATAFEIIEHIINPDNNQISHIPSFKT